MRLPSLSLAIFQPKILAWIGDHDMALSLAIFQRSYRYYCYPDLLLVLLFFNIISVIKEWNEKLNS